MFTTLSGVRCNRPRHEEGDELLVFASVNWPIEVERGQSHRFLLAS